VLFALLML